MKQVASKELLSRKHQILTWCLGIGTVLFASEISRAATAPCPPPIPGYCEVVNVPGHLPPPVVWTPPSPPGAPSWHDPVGEDPPPDDGAPGPTPYPPELENSCVTIDMNNGLFYYSNAANYPSNFPGRELVTNHPILSRLPDKIPAKCESWLAYMQYYVDLMIQKFEQIGIPEEFKVHAPDWPDWQYTYDLSVIEWLRENRDSETLRLALGYAQAAATMVDKWGTCLDGVLRERGLNVSADGGELIICDDNPAQPPPSVGAP